MANILQTILIYASAGVWILALVLMGIGVPVDVWRPIGGVSFFVSTITWLYSTWGWAYLSKATGIPDLRGTWRATLVSNWNAPVSTVPAAEIEAYFAIEQTASNIIVRMMTAESRSVTIVAKIEKLDGGVQVVGTYRNEPEIDFRHRSPIHYGGLQLTVGGPPAMFLKGGYWTDRLTRGKIEAELCTAVVAADFAMAQSLCAISQNPKP